MHGNNYWMQMHADKRAADIHARTSAAMQVFHHYRILEASNRFHRKCATSMKLRLHPYLLKIKFLHATAFHYKTTVQMLAALRRKKEPAFPHTWQNRIHDCLCSIHV